MLGPGKERIEWAGTLNHMDSGEVAARIIWEFPRRVRMEKQLDPEADRNVEFTVYDGEILRKSHGLVKPEQPGLGHSGEIDNSDCVFSLEIYDGESGRLVDTVTGRRLAAEAWYQINGILGNYSPRHHAGICPHQADLRKQPLPGPRGRRRRRRPGRAQPRWSLLACSKIVGR